MTKTAPASRRRITLNLLFDETSIKALLLSDMSQIIVLNKFDLLDENSIEALIKQISPDNNAEAIAVSAFRDE